MALILPPGANEEGATAETELMRTTGGTMIMPPPSAPPAPPALAPTAAPLASPATPASSALSASPSAPAPAALPTKKLKLPILGYTVATDDSGKLAITLAKDGTQAQAEFEETTRFFAELYLTAEAEAHDAQFRETREVRPSAILSETENLVPIERLNPLFPLYSAIAEYMKAQNLLSGTKQFLTEMGAPDVDTLQFNGEVLHDSYALDNYLTQTFGSAETLFIQFKQLEHIADALKRKRNPKKKYSEEQEAALRAQEDGEMAKLGLAPSSRDRILEIVTKRYTQINTILDLVWPVGAHVRNYKLQPHRLIHTQGAERVLHAWASSGAITEAIAEFERVDQVTNFDDDTHPGFFNSYTQSVYRQAVGYIQGFTADGRKTVEALPANLTARNRRTTQEIFMHPRFSRVVTLLADSDVHAVGAWDAEDEEINLSELKRVFPYDHAAATQLEAAFLDVTVSDLMRSGNSTPSHPARTNDNARSDEAADNRATNVWQRNAPQNGSDDQRPTNVLPRPTTQSWSKRRTMAAAGVSAGVVLTAAVALGLTSRTHPAPASLQTIAATVKEIATAAGAATNASAKPLTYAQATASARPSSKQKPANNSPSALASVPPPSAKSPAAPSQKTGDSNKPTSGVLDPWARKQ